MIYLHKIVGILLSLSYILLILFVFSIITKKRWLAYLIVFTTIIFSTGVVSNKLFQILERPAIRKTPDEVQNTNAIIVLGGMLGHTKTKSGNAVEWSDPDRFFGGIELFKSKKGKYLVFMGTKLPWTNAKVNDGVILKEYAVNFGINKDSIIVTANVESTEAEANAVYELFKNKGNRIILVTSAFHMKRAKLIFEKKGFVVEAYPVDFHTNDDKTDILDFIPTIGNLAQSEFVMREFLGIIIYSLKSL
jgi:uncharacterized SAM-binding protein YcdF (DUF218 family)